MCAYMCVCVSVQMCMQICVFVCASNSNATIESLTAAGCQQWRWWWWLVVGEEVGAGGVELMTRLSLKRMFSIPALCCGPRAWRRCECPPAYPLYNITCASAHKMSISLPSIALSYLLWNVAYTLVEYHSFIVTCTRKVCHDFDKLWIPDHSPFPLFST